MSSTPTVAAPRAAAATAAPRGSFTQLVAMEWTKLRALRSVALTLLAGAVLIIGLAVTYAVRGEAGGVLALMLIAGQVLPLFTLALGALVITGEYASGMIHTTLVAAPQRGRLYAAKAVVLTAATWVYGALATIACWLAGGIVLGGGFDATAGATVRLIAANATWIMAIAVMTFGIGAALRSTAGTVALSFGLTVVAPSVLDGLLSEDLGARIVSYMLQDASVVLLSGEGAQYATYGRWAALAVIGAWVAAALAAGYVILKRRDA